MIDEALSELGGVEYLVKQGKANPVAFLALVGKRLPRDIKLGGEGGPAIVFEIRDFSRALKADANG